LVEFNPYAYETHEDPYPVYRRLRDEAPLYRNEDLGFWALSRHADVLAAFKDVERFSNRHGVSVDADAFHDGADATMSFLAMDPPRHTRMRSLVSRGFTPRRVSALEPRVREIAIRHVEGFVERGACDFVADFAGKLPMDVISEMIGVPEEDRATLRKWADLVVHREEGNEGLPASTLEAAARMLDYLVEMLADRRQHRRNDLTGALIEAEIDGDRLTDHEIIGFLFLMSIAGNETTTKLLANAVYWLWRNPSERDAGWRRRCATTTPPRPWLGWSRGTWRSTGNGCAKATSSCCWWAPPTGTSACSRIQTASTSCATPVRWCPSVRATTSVWERRWRGWRAGWPWRRCSGASPTSRSTPAASRGSTP
jgi:cytochrome P450